MIYSSLSSISMFNDYEMAFFSVIILNLDKRKYTS